MEHPKLRRSWPFSRRSARIEWKLDWTELKLDLLLKRSETMAIDLTKLNAGVAAAEAALAALRAQVADLQAKVGETAADQQAVDAAGDKLVADAQPAASPA